ncbi:hypothetical protein Y032_0039g29 [Ancylostoma ceylanicum]|uniref:Mos1 transposase HTH domain-containing protein n=2 Tax=Ancylostoma ceylanicum TaxID=53326 RepID=A0A016UI20_9BILA|nr:hypothetical protein Y032_0039g29 [Ancylostoma ceylanicum]
MNSTPVWSGAGLIPQCNVVPQVPSMFVPSKEESSAVNVPQGYECAVMDTSHGLSALIREAPTDSQHRSSDVKPQYETSAFSGAGLHEQVQDGVIDEKSTLYTGFSATDLLGQADSCEDTPICIGESTAEQHLFNAFDESPSCDQEDNGDTRNSAEVVDEVYSGDSPMPSCASNIATDLSSCQKEETGAPLLDGSAQENSKSSAPSLTPEQMQLIETMYKADPNKSIADLASEAGASEAAVRSYLRSSGLQDSVLNEAQLQCRLEMCSALSLRNSREPFLSRIITYGEMVIPFESQKRHPNLPRGPVQNVRQRGPGKKILLTVWWSSSGLICHQFMHGNHMAAEHLHRQIVEVHRRIHTNNPELAHGLGPILLCENPRPHLTRDLTTKMYQCGFEILPYPSHAKDLLPSHYYFFPHLIKYMENKDYAKALEVRKDFHNFISTRTPNFFADGMNELASRWNQCIESNGHYIDF